MTTVQIFEMEEEKLEKKKRKRKEPNQVYFHFVKSQFSLMKWNAISLNRKDS